MTAGFVAHVTEVHDGDSLTVMADLLPLLGVQGTVIHKIRLAGINAPELAVAGKPNQPGLDARSFLAGLASGRDCLVAIDGVDKFGGRVDADVWLAGDAVTLSQHMIASGQAKPWDGRGPRP